MRLHQQTLRAQLYVNEAEQGIRLGCRRPSQPRRWIVRYADEPSLPIVEW